jgi:hypothetical protein
VRVLFTSDPVHNSGIRLATGPFESSGPESLIYLYEEEFSCVTTHSVCDTTHD